ncbi:MAG: hypothetical protein M3Q44_07995 [bacterium]|nr:hypothetical protein [bacterium]
MWLLYLVGGLFFAVATGLADGNAVSRASMGWTRNPNGMFPSINWEQLFASAGFFIAGIILYHLYVGVMIQANVKSALLQNLIWVTIMTLVVAYQDQALQHWSVFQKGFAVAIILQLLLLLIMTGQE